MGVDDIQSNEQVGLDFPPLLDLRLFSHSDLYSISRASSSASNFHDNDDVLLPKIDRSLFNESAGSRKQTYSRLRFATRKLQFSSAATSPNVSACRQFPEEEERSKVITLFKQLFADESPTSEKNEECISDEDEGLVPIHIGRVSDESMVDATNIYIQNIPVEVVSEMGEMKKKKRGRPRKNENPINVAIWNISHGVVSEIGEQGKRKRGRPRKNEIQGMCISSVVIETGRRDCLEEAMEVEKEKVVVNKHGNVMDLAAFGNTENGFGGELGEHRKRKRGRPRKNEIQGIQNSPALHETVGREHVEVARDMEKDELIVNKQGNVLDLPASINTEDQHVEELGEQTKRKRGRPRKKKNRGIFYAPLVRQTLGREQEKEVWDMKKEMVIVNENGNVVDLALLGRVENPFEEELRKRTEGIETETELLGFLRSLDGDWGSWRERRKIVRASDFGEVLPRGWRLVLSIKKQKGLVLLHCRGYISPNGRQFVSCKEVASYLLSLYERQGAKQVESGHIGESQLASSTVSRHNADLNREDGSGADIVCSSRLLVASIPSDHKEQSIFLETSNTLNSQSDEALKCLHWNMGFNEQKDFEAPAIISPEKCKNLTPGECQDSAYLANCWTVSTMIWRSYDATQGFAVVLVGSIWSQNSIESRVGQLAEKIEAAKKVARLDLKLTVEERKKVSTGYKNIVGSRRACWLILSAIEKEEEALKKNDYNG